MDGSPTPQPWRRRKGGWVVGLAAGFLVLDTAVAFLGVPGTPALVAATRGISSPVSSAGPCTPPAPPPTTQDGVSSIRGGAREGVCPLRSSRAYDGPGGQGKGKGGKDRELTKRQLRVGRLLQSALATLIRNGYDIKTTDILDDRIRAKISVVDVNCSPDLRSARVEVSIFGETVEKREAFIWLVNNAKPIRHALAREMRDFRHTPELFFRQTDLGSGAEMFALLESLGDRRRGEGEGFEGEDGDDYVDTYADWGAEEDGEEKEEEVVWEDSDDEGEDVVEWEEGEEDELEAWLNVGSNDNGGGAEKSSLSSIKITGAPSAEEEEEMRAFLESLDRQAESPPASSPSSKRRRIVPKKMDIGSGGLRRGGAGTWANRPFQPGQLERELAMEIESLRRTQGVAPDDDDVMLDEDEDDDEEGEEEEEEEGGEVVVEVGDSAEDRARIEKGWIDMDKILDEMEGQEDIERLLEELGGDNDFDDTQEDHENDDDWLRQIKAVPEDDSRKVVVADEPEVIGPLDDDKIPPSIAPPPRGQRERGGRRQSNRPDRRRWFYGNNK